MQSLVPFLLFAVVASITPGPTNILVLSNSQRHGLAAAWPIVLGACAAVAALILLLGLGLGELLRRHPLLQQGARLARRRLAQLPGLEPVPQRGRHRRRGAAAAPRRARRRGVATGQSQGLDDGPRRAGTVRRGRRRTGRADRPAGIAVLPGFAAVPGQLGLARRRQRAAAALAVADETLQPRHGAVVAGIGLGRPAALRRSGSFLTNLWVGTPGPGWLWWDDP